VDGCRVGTNGESLSGGSVTSVRQNPMTGDNREGAALGMFAPGAARKDDWQQPSGRWPANLLLSHHPECNGACVESCPVRMLDEQSGESISRQGVPRAGRKGNGWGMTHTGGEYSDTGGASRFYTRFHYSAKASRRERNLGIEGVTLELEVYLCGANMEQAQSLERAISEYMTGLETLECSTTLYGKKPMVQSHRVTLSTTSTEINKTIDSKTWFVSTLLPTSAFIAGVIETLPECGSSLVSSAENTSQSLISMSEKAASARGAKLVVSETPLRISASARPTVNVHPTVKSLDVMRWLCKLTKTPTGGVVLDPFMGSGTTGMAAVLEGREFVGIELERESFEIAQARIAWAQEQQPTVVQETFLR